MSTALEWAQGQATANGATSREFRPQLRGETQDGRATAKLLLDVYGHFLPSEYIGYADALSRPLGAR